MQIAADSKPLFSEMQAKMEQYRTELLAFGMQEPSKRESSVGHWYFFKPMMERTAFIVNLIGNDQYIEIIYGYTSTAFTRLAGDENALIERGVSEDNITIREKFIVCDEADEETARTLIVDMYSKYFQTQKDDLLIFAKEKRKAFIQQIAVKLKPLGFKKKANTWLYTLEGEYYLRFIVQKSTFSDEYYFNVYIGKNDTDEYGDCYYTRVAPQGMCPVDWQLLCKEKFDLFLDQTVLPTLSKIINTPLNDLGKISSFWSGCHCERNKCQSCWMQKNVWDLIEENVFYLPVKTTEGLVNLEVKHTIIPQDDENVSVILSTMVQGVLYSYESDTTEKNLISLAKNLPEGWVIKACISCRYGHFCPVGNYDNELFCVTDFDLKEPCDLWYVTENENERKKRSRTLFDCCEKYEEQSKDYFTYSDYYYEIGK